MERRESFAGPYAATLTEPEQHPHTAEYLRGLLSQRDRKTGEAIAYVHDHPRQGLQKFIGHVPGDHQPPLTTPARRVAADRGEPDAVIVFGPPRFPRKGTTSVGVARPWCGRLGKVENCQGAVYMGHVSRKDHALVNARLDLPKEWTRPKARRAEAGVPETIRFRTRHELARQMPDGHGARLPRGWVAGDDEMGRPTSVRRALRGREQRYLLAVPSNTLVRDRDQPAPPYSGRGRHPQAPLVRVDRWCRALPETRWAAADVRDGEKGPLAADVVTCRVRARTETGGAGPDDVLFIARAPSGWRVQARFRCVGCGTGRDRARVVTCAQGRPSDRRVLPAREG